jgi:hypothetical protein
MTSPLLIDSDNLPGLVPNGRLLRSPQISSNSNTVFNVKFANPPPREVTCSRITELREIALEDGIAVNNLSEKDLHRFLLNWPGASDPAIFLLDNGNFRIRWDAPDGRQIALQFLGDDSVQFVLFAQREGAEQPTRSAGRDTAEGVLKQIRSLDLLSILYQ